VTANLPARRPARLPGANVGPGARLARPISTEIIANRSAHLLKAELHRGQQAGEYGPASAIARTPAGQYAVKVHRLKRRPPRWRRPVLIAAVALAVLGGVVAAAWWALATLAAAIPGGLVGGVALLVLLLVAAGKVGGGRVVEVLVRVNVR
jgi:hypothetical protein